MESLWGDEFVIKETPKETKKLIEKIKNPKKDITVVAEKAIKSKSVSIEDKLQLIRDNVYQILGVYKENTVVIKNKEQLHDYIMSAIHNGVIAVDTETNNSLDPITCKIMGLCIYTPGQKNAYVPVNHINYQTNERLEWQLTESDIKEQLQFLLDSNTPIIMHNGKFDYQVIKCTCGIELSIYWDTLIGAKLLDENERSAGLKQQYIEKIDPSIQKYDIEHLFSIEYAVVDPDIFALYAATDAFMTYKLYLYQRDLFMQTDMQRVYSLFTDIEMPLVHVIAEMELQGMAIDQEYAQRLSAKYHKKLDAIDIELNAELAKLQPTIAEWRQTPDANYHPPKKSSTDSEAVGKSKSEQLTDPINLASPTQLAILIYDILKCPVVNKKSPRGTGEEELKSIAEKLKLPVFDLIIKRREQIKLLSTYIDVIPEIAKRWDDGRVRTHFNQYGAATGRLSSSEPLNFQNIPSHNKDIRLLFTAKPGYKIVGGDFSAQEPRLTAQYAQDPQMIQAYIDGKDLYAVIASASFNKPYEDCLEFYPEGTEIEYEGKKIICGHKTHQNKEGKNRRSMAKSILLGILYGRGAKSVGEQIGKTKEEAQEIIDKFFNAFPNVQKWINTTISDAHKNGYVEDVAGRRRRLPDIQLEKYAISSISKDNVTFNPILDCVDRPNTDVLNKIETYRNKLEKAKWKADVDKIKTDALANGIEIHDNNGYIAQAERQAVNSRVQGGAATLTKVALITLFNDSRLNELGAKLVNTVHDEILIEVPEQYADEAAEILSSDMINSAKKYVDKVPMKTDTYIVNSWYEDEMEVLLKETFKKLQNDHSEQEALNILYEDYCNFTKEQINNFLA